MMNFQFKRHRFSVLLVLGLVFFVIQAPAKYRIYYKPFGAETFMPIGGDEIEKQAEFEFEYQDELLDHIFKVNKASKSKEVINAPNLRGKILRLKDRATIFLNKPQSLLSKKMVSFGDEALSNRLIEQLESKSQEACKDPTASFVKKAKGCNH